MCSAEYSHNGWLWYDQFCHRWPDSICGLRRKHDHRCGNCDRGIHQLDRGCLWNGYLSRLRKVDIIPRPQATKTERVLDGHGSHKFSFYLYSSALRAHRSTPRFHPLETAGLLPPIDFHSLVSRFLFQYPGQELLPTTMSITQRQQRNGRPSS
jgi:hypothetical protein